MKNVLYYILIYPLLLIFVMIPQLLQYIYNVIIWRFSEKKYLDKLVYFKGRQRPVVIETYHHFYLKGTNTSFLKDDYQFNNNEYLIMKAKS